MKILDPLRSKRDRFAQLDKSVATLTTALETAQAKTVALLKKTDPDSDKEVARLHVARNEEDLAGLRLRKAQDEAYAAQTELLGEASAHVRGFSRFVEARAVECRESWYDVNEKFWPSRAELIREHQESWVPREQAIRRCGALVDHIPDNGRPFELLRGVDRMIRIISESCATYSWTLPENLRTLERVVSPEAAAAGLLMRQRKVVYLCCTPEKPKRDYEQAQREIAEQIAAPDWQPPELVTVTVKEDCAFGLRQIHGPGKLVFPLVHVPEPLVKGGDIEKIERTFERLGIKPLKSGDVVQLLRWEWAGLSRHFDLVETAEK